MWKNFHRNAKQIKSWKNEKNKYKKWHINETLILCVIHLFTSVKFNTDGKKIQSAKLLQFWRFFLVIQIIVFENKIATEMETTENLAYGV